MTEMISPEELTFLAQKNKALEIESMMTQELKTAVMDAIRQGIYACEEELKKLVQDQVSFTLVDYQLGQPDDYVTSNLTTFRIEVGYGKQFLLIDREDLAKILELLADPSDEGLIKGLERGLDLYYGQFSEALKVPIQTVDCQFDTVVAESLDLLQEIKIYELKIGGVEIQMIHLSDMDFMERTYAQEEEEEETTPTIQKPLFSPLEEVTEPNSSHDLGLLHDVPLEISVVLGKTKRSIGEILEVNVGKVIELDKFADDPLEIYCNGKLIAEGEAVVIEGNFGVKVTKLFQNGMQNFK